MTGDIIETPKYKEIVEPEKNILRVSTEFIKEKGIYEETEVIEGICQHNITWDRLSKLKKTDAKLFIDELYLFLQTYVVENADGDYICKSCGFYLNIKKYIQDGKFDDSSKKFIVYGMPLDKPLEEITQYEKYKGSIRSIDKFIEKISLISNISYYVGNSQVIKSRRKIIIKDVIDIILENNKLLKRNYKDRNEKVAKLYGITNSNLFVFDLDNSIFVFSSKDKDYLKPIQLFDEDSFFYKWYDEVWHIWSTQYHPEPESKELQIFLDVIDDNWIEKLWQKGNSPEDSALKIKRAVNLFFKPTPY